MAVPIRASVIDADTEDYLPDVAIYLVGGNGQPSTLLGNTNANGVFEIPAPTFGQKIQIDFPGYKPEVVDPAYLAPDQRIKLTAEPSGSLSEFVVKSVRKIKKINFTLPVVLGSAAVVTFGIWLWRKYRA